MRLYDASERTRFGLCGLLLITGCSPEGATHDAEPSDAGVAIDQADESWGWTAPTDTETYQPTFYGVYYEILLPSCALVFCHGSDGYFTLSRPDHAYASLVSAPASSKECAPTGLLRIQPGSPEQSLLYLKITTPPCGERMPLQLGGGVPLEARRIDQIKTWIERGALPFDEQ
jgi:hypothetical protein